MSLCLILTESSGIHLRVHSGCCRVERKVLGFRRVVVDDRGGTGAQRPKSHACVVGEIIKRGAGSLT